ncbi:MAG TPA: YfhO family protein [Bryobacteraceae bacterium]|jgi:hypothetical protein|nr:YfhO family protein [Bryobacteraceae bacterium]
MEVSAWLAKRQTFSAALLLILALHLCFFPFIWGNKTLLTASRGITASILPDGAFYGSRPGPAIPRSNDSGAAAWLPEPYAALVHHVYLHEKHLPLWNPYESYGAPLAADMQSQPFSPLFFLYAMVPGPRTYNFFILARFLVTGFCTYLFLRLFLPFVPSIAGGVACMLSGYYILFYNMPHLSVEMLVPAMFLATERLLREQSAGNAMLSIAVTFLCIVGGMPESAFLALAFCGAYFFFRLAAGPHTRTARVTQLKYFLFVQGLGLALAAFLLVPFFEFTRLSFNTHQPANLNGYVPGLAHDALGISLFTYVMPMLFGAGPSVAPGLGGIASLRGFMGVVQILFAVVALAGLTRRLEKRFAGKRRLTLFFFGSAAVIVLKRYGAPIINWIGHLPFWQLILFPKYDEPLLAFALAVLCACGIHCVLTDTINRRRLIVSILIVFGMLVGALAFSWFPVRAANVRLHEFYLSLAGAGALLFLAALVLLGPARPASQTWLSAALVALLAVEVAGDYIYPVYYGLTDSASDDANPYRGAPYIDYLKAGTGSEERVVGRKGILHPDWSGVFQLGDIRGVDALYYRKYYDFIRFFLREDIPPGARGDLVNSFTGLRWPPFDSPLKQRLLQLSSVKFLLSLEPYILTPGRAPEIVRQNEGRLLPGRENLIEVRTFTISGETKAVLYEHPIYERLPFKITVTPASREFSFSLAMQPSVYDGSMPLCGDGVEFRLEIRDSAGRIRSLYDRYIDPKHNPAERRWIPGLVDLSAYMGQTVELLFTTTAGPKGDTCAAWAGWGDPRFNGDVAQKAFRQVYDHEIKIYEYPDYLPRAALFSSVEVAQDDAAALASLGSPDFDIFQTAVVSSTGLETTDMPAIGHLNTLPRERVRAARILSYTSQEVKIDAAVERPALLVLNDSDYPGWKVYVDGRRSHWITANYLFRGVLLQPGRHLVRFAYEPASFAAGAAISGVALICVAGFAVWRRRRPGSGVAEADLV